MTTFHSAKVEGLDVFYRQAGDPSNPRGIPAVLYLPRLGRSQTVAAGLLQATSLPFIVTATQIGQVTGRIDAVTAAALVSAGLLSVISFPAVSVSLLRRGAGDEHGVVARSSRLVT